MLLTRLKCYKGVNIKYIILFSLFISNTYANEAIDKTIEAIRQTKEIKHIENTIKKQAQKHIENINPEILGLTAIAINQEVGYNINKRHKINVNYRNKSLTYQFNYEF